ncbi:unnamed protein product, partial [Iphiclides podalirius]
MHLLLLNERTLKALEIGEQGSAAGNCRRARILAGRGKPRFISVADPFRTPWETRPHAWRCTSPPGLLERAGPGNSARHFHRLSARKSVR